RRDVARAVDLPRSDGRCRLAALAAQPHDAARAGRAALAARSYQLPMRTGTSARGVSQRDEGGTVERDTIKLAILRGGIVGAAHHWVFAGSTGGSQQCPIFRPWRFCCVALRLICSTTMCRDFTFVKDGVGLPSFDWRHFTGRAWRASWQPLELSFERVELQFQRLDLG